MSASGGPRLPGESPPLISWQVRQLPLPRSKASFSPSETEGCACRGAHEQQQAQGGTGDNSIAAKGCVPDRIGFSSLRPLSPSYFGCISSSGPVVRGVRSLPSAEDMIFTSSDRLQSLHAGLGRGIGTRILPDEAVAVRHLHLRQAVAIGDEIIRHDVVEVEHVGRQRIDVVGGQAVRRVKRHRPIDVVPQASARTANSCRPSARADRRSAFLRRRSSLG